MKVLYLSGMHPTLEYDQCILLEELGIDWFSTGVYLNPKKPLPLLNLRKEIDKEPNLDLIDQFLRLNPNYFGSFSKLGRPTIVVNKELVSNFDVILSSSVSILKNNWEYLKDKPIIWRPTGVLNQKNEDNIIQLQNGNIEVVRFSPIEFNSVRHAGGRVIRNFVDEDIYCDWNGTVAEVLTFQSWFRERRACKFNQKYLEIRSKTEVPMRLHGAQSSKDPISLGTVSWEEQVELYKNSKVYFYLGSPVGVVAYNYLEAMMTGAPIVTFGPEIGGIVSPSGGKLLHEPSSFIENGVNGFYSDSTPELLDYISRLVEDSALSKSISIKARETALKLFSKDKAIKEWREFFTSI